MRACIAALVVIVMMIGCGDDDAPDEDAGIDAAIDSGTDAGSDAGPMCAPACEPGTACCDDEEGPACVALASDIHHCGFCGLDCIATRRGDSCQAAQCACGEFVLGCVGSFASSCCVPPEGGGPPVCADLARSREHCGDCNVECAPEQADRCDGGRCVCGDERIACAGTDTDRCCGDRFEVFSCVDVTSDRDHCGECGNRCNAGFRCAAGECVPL
ncbi:hypothetical protein [Sandaracinus amylolyticus]|uniref:hypothetical protein n=1 Tax=Sandaracinus amylolyticus TaxID=927083 RepID=UPI001F2E2E47|nr:hypothetical protein [Sandaracinus amylolyticus]UJR81132.1 Tryptophan synthase alpha chain [Sandaracinus amylolyticus]